jgi:hypothetical protein
MRQNSAGTSSRVKSVHNLLHVITHYFFPSIREYLTREFHIRPQLQDFLDTIRSHIKTTGTATRSMKVVVYTIHCSRFFDSFLEPEWYDMELGDTFRSLLLQIEAREAIPEHAASLYCMHRLSIILINPRHSLSAVVRGQLIVFGVARNNEEQVVSRLLHRHAEAA